MMRDIFWIVKTPVRLLRSKKKRRSVPAGVSLVFFHLALQSSCHQGAVTRALSCCFRGTLAPG